MALFKVGDLFTATINPHFIFKVVSINTEDMSMRYDARAIDSEHAQWLGVRHKGELKIKNTMTLIYDKKYPKRRGL